MILTDQEKISFLLSDQSTLMLENESYNEVLLKLPYEENRFVRLYKVEISHNANDKEYTRELGTFDKTKGVFYPNFSFNADFISTSSIENYSELKNRYIEETNKKILESVFSNYAIYLSDTYGEIDRITENAYEMYIKKGFVKFDDILIEMLKTLNSFPNNNNDLIDMKILIQYLSDPVNSTQNSAIDFCTSETGIRQIAGRVNYAKQISEIMEDIKGNLKKYENLYMRRGIYDALDYIDCKNVNVTLKIDNDEITFKYPKDDLKRHMLFNHRDFNTYSKSYDKLNDFLKEHNLYHDYQFNAINEIKYGKNILYQKQRNNSIIAKSSHRGFTNEQRL